MYKFNDCRFVDVEKQTKFEGNGTLSVVPDGLHIFNKKKKMRWILPKACPSNVPTQEGQRKSSVFLASKKTLVGLIKSV